MIINCPIQHTCPNRNCPCHAIRKSLPFPCRINNNAPTFLYSEVGDVEIKARGAEGAVVGVSIGRFEVAGAVEEGGVP